jgi:hypothetical protein
MDLCLGVMSIVFVKVSLLSRNLTFTVVMLFAMSRTLSTLIFYAIDFISDYFPAFILFFEPFYALFAV